MYDPLLEMRKGKFESSILRFKSFNFHLLQFFIFYEFLNQNYPNLQVEEIFRDHAVENHPLSFVLFGKIPKDEEELNDNFEIGKPVSKIIDDFKDENIENTNDENYGGNEEGFDELPLDDDFIIQYPEESEFKQEFNEIDSSEGNFIT